jgi:capsular exopolysaccharide synthesis family protein
VYKNQLETIRRWWWILVVVPALSGVTAFALSKLATPIYEASVKLWVSQATAAGGQQYTDILAAERLAKTYGALITTRPVLQQTIDDLQLKMTPDELVTHIDVSMVRDTQLLKVTLRHTNATSAATIVNKLADVFQAQNQDAEKQSFNLATQKMNAQEVQLESQIQDTEGRLATLKAATAPTDAQRSEIERLTTALSQYQVAYSSVLKGIEDIRLSEANKTNNVTVAEKAVVSTVPVSPRVSINMLMGLAFGTVVAIALTFVMSRLDDSFKSAEDIQSALGLSTVGVVERIGSKRKRSKRNNLGRIVGEETLLQPLVFQPHVSSHVAEAYRLLRTNLDFAGLDKPIRKLMVTSTLPREGKSTTAANLAVVTAESGKRVLLIDLDLRRPTLHKLFHIPNNRGLTSILLGASTIEETIRDSGVQNLYILTSGPMPPSPADTINSSAMTALLESLTGKFDVLIVDSPPVVIASDAIILSSRMDGVLLVIGAYSTSKRVCRGALEALQRGTSPIVGAVLNMQQQSKRQAYYYYNYETDPQVARRGPSTQSGLNTESAALRTLQSLFLDSTRK